MPAQKSAVGVGLVLLYVYKKEDSTCSCGGWDSFSCCPAVDAVVFCTGRHLSPNQELKYTTFKNFDGTFIHNLELKALEAMDGKRALVVGAAVSESDTTGSAILAKRGTCKTVVNAVRGLVEPALYHRCLVSGPRIWHSLECQISEQSGLLQSLVPAT